MHTRRLLSSSFSSVYSSSSVLLRVSVFLAVSVHCFVDVVESVSTDTSYVGQGGEVLLPCDYEGEISIRAIGLCPFLFRRIIFLLFILILLGYPIGFGWPSWSHSRVFPVSTYLSDLSDLASLASLIRPFLAFISSSSFSP